jgi:hypothetical protein
MRMTLQEEIPGGAVYELPSDWKTELLRHPDPLAAGHDITPLSKFARLRLLPGSITALDWRKWPAQHL